MSLHETKYCPRCSKPFECKPGNITQCQCFGVPISLYDLELIKDAYEDCLCRDCLLELNDKFKNNKGEIIKELTKKYSEEINEHRK